MPYIIPSIPKWSKAVPYQSLFSAAVLQVKTKDFI